MANPQQPNQPNYVDTPLVIYHSIRQDLTDAESEELSKRLAAATISQEAWFVLDEMRVEAIESLANIPYKPEAAATYAALVMESKVRALVIGEILTHFKDKIR